VRQGCLGGRCFGLTTPSAKRRLQAQSLGRPFLPSGLAIRRAAHRRSSQRLEFAFALRSLHVVQPVRGHWQRTVVDKSGVPAMHAMPKTRPPPGGRLLHQIRPQWVAFHNAVASSKPDIPAQPRPEQRLPTPLNFSKLSSGAAVACRIETWICRGGLYRLTRLTRRSPAITVSISDCSRHTVAGSGPRRPWQSNWRRKWPT